MWNPEERKEAELTGGERNARQAQRHWGYVGPRGHAFSFMMNTFRGPTGHHGDYAY